MKLFACVLMVLVLGFAWGCVDCVDCPVDGCGDEGADDGDECDDGGADDGHALCSVPFTCAPGAYDCTSGVPMIFSDIDFSGFTLVGEATVLTDYAEVHFDARVHGYGLFAGVHTFSLHYACTRPDTWVLDIVVDGGAPTSVVVPGLGTCTTEFSYIIRVPVGDVAFSSVCLL